MIIRAAKSDDVTACVAMIEARREQYQKFEPRFWKKATNSAALTLPRFDRLFNSADAVSLVAEEGGDLAGFIVATDFPAPPVYDPGGANALIDDFCVKSEDLWPTVGALLLSAAKTALKERGYAQVVVVGAQQDRCKNALLRQTDLSIASNWWTGVP